MGVLCPLNTEVVAFVNHHGLDKLLDGSGVPVDLVWMAFERSRAVDWDHATRTGHFPYGAYFRYDPYSGDIDDMPNGRRGGDKFLNSTWAGAPVRFTNGRHVDSLAMADYYRYESLRLFGDESIVHTFSPVDTPLHSVLVNPPPREERAYAEAIERRYYPFGRNWFA